MEVSAIYFVVSYEANQVASWYDEPSLHLSVYHTDVVRLVWADDRHWGFVEDPIAVNPLNHVIASPGEPKEIR